MDQSSVEKSSLRSDREWAALYKVGAVAAFIYVAMMLAPLVLMIVAPVPPMEGGAAILDYVNAHRAVYFAELVCFVGLCIPAMAMFLALGIALRSASPSFALLGSALGIASEIAAFALGSSPPSLSWALAELATRYATAVGPARDALAAGAEALAANANAVSLVGVLTALGILIVSSFFAKGALGRAAGIIGIVTGASGIVLEAFRPYVGAVYGLYGILLPAWSVAVGIGLARKARMAASGDEETAD
jgi:hypothetical protein